MKMNVDFSVNTVGGNSIGSVDGEMEFRINPLIGDTIYFSSSSNGTAIPSGHKYGGLLKVQERIIRPNHDGNSVMLSLEDLTVDSREQALSIMQYLEDCYGLFATIYE